MLSEPTPLTRNIHTHRERERERINESKWHGMELYVWSVSIIKVPRSVDFSRHKERGYCSVLSRLFPGRYGNTSWGWTVADNRGSLVRHPHSQPSQRPYSPAAHLVPRTTLVPRPLQDSFSPKNSGIPCGRSEYFIFFYLLTEYTAHISNIKEYISNNL